MGPALIDVKVTMTSAHGWKPVVFHYQKKCGGHKNGFRVWLPSSHMVNGNDRTKRIVYGAGEKKLMSPSTEAGDLERKEEEEIRVLQASSEDAEDDVQAAAVLKDLEDLPERTMIVEDGIVDAPWGGGSGGDRLDKERNNQETEDDTEMAVVPGTVTTMFIAFELGRATPATKDLPRKDRLLQETQHVANVRVEIKDDAADADKTKKKKTKTKTKKKKKSFLTIKSVKGTMITNRTYYQKKIHPNGQKFHHQYQTVMIEYICPNGGWFPKIWNEGVFGKGEKGKKRDEFCLF